MAYPARVSSSSPWFISPAAPLWCFYHVLAQALLLIAYVVGCLYVGVRLLSPGTPVRAVRHRKGCPRCCPGAAGGAACLGSVGNDHSHGDRSHRGRGAMGTEAPAYYGIGVRLELLMIPVIFVGGDHRNVGKAVGAGDRSRAIRVGWTGPGRRWYWWA